MKALVTEIGAHAFDDGDRMIILFGSGATEHLKQYSIIQKFQENASLELKKGDKIKIDEKEYPILFIGPLANTNLNTIAHVTLIFDDVPNEDLIANGIYLPPNERPTIKIGTIIEYLSN